MAKNKDREAAPIYGDRETLDNDLETAVRDILSAEEQVKRMRAEASVFQREAREKQSARFNEMRDELVRAAIERANAENKRRMETATVDGEKLLASKKSQIEKLTAKAYSELGGK